MNRALSTTLWVLFTVVAVVTGLGAASVVRSAVSGTASRPLSAAEVSAQLDQVRQGPGGSPSGRPSGPLDPDPSATAGPQPSGDGRAGVARTLASRGGSVVAVCGDGRVYLRSWSPAAGFVVEEAHRGPSREAEITFESTTGTSAEVQLQVTCRSGVPVLATDGSADDS